MWPNQVITDQLVCSVSLTKCLKNLYIPGSTSSWLNIKFCIAINLAFVKITQHIWHWLKLFYYIRQSIEDQYYTLGIYLDLTKAFDTVDHTIILTKQHHYIICGITNDWFKHYLTVRKQYTLANRETSDIANVEAGVPLGSVLAPPFPYLH